MTNYILSVSLYYTVGHNSPINILLLLLILLVVVFLLFLLLLLLLLLMALQPISSPDLLNWRFRCNAFISQTLAFIISLAPSFTLSLQHIVIGFHTRRNFPGWPQLKFTFTAFKFRLVAEQHFLHCVFHPKIRVFLFLLFVTFLSYTANFNLYSS